jgi:osmoprotectant transport system substrate-binding protein
MSQMRISPVSLRRGTLAAVAATAALCLAACGSSSSGGGSGTSKSPSSSPSSSASNPLAGGAPKGTVVVGSANFPEDELLAEIYVLALQAQGIKVTSKFNIGAREVYYPEIEKGAVSIIPEYNGALLTTSVDTTSTASTTTQVNAALKAKLPSSLEILNSSSAQDKDSVTVTQAFAKAHHLTSITQLKPLAKSMIIGGPPEFKTRSDGLIGLHKLYGLTFKNFIALDESGPITLSALKSGRVQAADVFTTTPQIITDHLFSLADPKFVFAAQNVTPLVYKSAMTPTIINTLNEISSKLTTTGLLAIDKAVILDKDPYAAVAAGWLKAVGIKS